MDESMLNKNGIEATQEILEYEKENNIKHIPIIIFKSNVVENNQEQAKHE